MEVQDVERLKQRLYDVAAVHLHLVVGRRRRIGIGKMKVPRCSEVG